MAAIAGAEQSGTEVPAPAARRAARRRSLPVWRWAILLVAGAYFLIPLYSALRFAGIKAFTQVASYQDFGSSFALSLRLAIIATVLTLVLMVPTTVYVYLRLPRVRRVMEAVTILPIIIPPIVLIIGVLKIAPGSLVGTPYLLGLEYVILAMPFAYRALDAGLRSFDVKTLVEASNSLGAGWPTTLWRVVIPNLRTAIPSATVLTIALVLGEYTMASLDNLPDLPGLDRELRAEQRADLGGGVAAGLVRHLDPAHADSDGRHPQRPQARRRPGHAVLRRHRGRPHHQGRARMTTNTAASAAATGSVPGSAAATRAHRSCCAR